MGVGSPPLHLAGISTGGGGGAPSHPMHCECYTGVLAAGGSPLIISGRAGIDRLVQLQLSSPCASACATSYCTGGVRVGVGRGEASTALWYCFGTHLSTPSTGAFRLRKGNGSNALTSPQSWKVGGGDEGGIDRLARLLIWCAPEQPVDWRLQVGKGKWQQRLNQPSMRRGGACCPRHAVGAPVAPKEGLVGER
jgi:hypothetical protein